MIYLAESIFDSTADAVIIPVTGTEDIPEGSIHQKFLAEVDLSYCEHYFREVKLGIWEYTPATCFFVREGDPWYQRWLIEVPCLPEDRFHAMQPRIERAIYLVNKLGAKSVAVPHLRCKIGTDAQEILWTWCERKLVDHGAEIHLHTQEWDDRDQPLIVQAMIEKEVTCA